MQFFQIKTGSLANPASRLNITGLVGLAGLGKMLFWEVHWFL
jgi:hypothetical protein